MIPVTYHYKEKNNDDRNPDSSPSRTSSPSPSSSSIAGTKKSRPQPSKTAFMCFSAAKKSEMKENLGVEMKGKDEVRRVAEEWRMLSPRDRAFWEEEARKDKLRYIGEKEAYTGPWEIPKRRAKKHPLAPKRPMSAFLKYSQSRRSIVKQKNPDMSNTDISRLLGEMWHTAPEPERGPYIERELEERAAYKDAIAKWRLKHAREEANKRELEERNNMFAPDQNSHNYNNSHGNYSNASYHHQNSDSYHHHGYQAYRPSSPPSIRNQNSNHEMSYSDYNGNLRRTGNCYHPSQQYQEYNPSTSQKAAIPPSYAQSESHNMVPYGHIATYQGHYESRQSDTYYSNSGTSHDQHRHSSLSLPQVGHAISGHGHGNSHGGYNEHASDFPAVHYPSSYGYDENYERYS